MLKGSESLIAKKCSSNTMLTCFSIFSLFPFTYGKMRKRNVTVFGYSIWLFFAMALSNAIFEEK